MAGLVEKRKELIALQKEIRANRQKLDEFAAQLQKECTHEVIMLNNNDLERSCFICAFHELWNPGMGFEKLGHPLIELPVNIAQELTYDEIDKFIRKQEKMPEFFKKYFGE